MLQGASLVAQLVNNLPAMQETWVRSLSWEDPLEKGKATDYSILVWRIPYIPWGHKDWTRLSNFRLLQITDYRDYPHGLILSDF